MKQLLALSVLLFVVGIAGFLYRNTMERPGIVAQEACTLEAKICPDGSSVGRSGPSCSFAPCAFPNVEIPDFGMSFAVPTGYVQSEVPATGALITFEKPATIDWPAHTISIYRYDVPEGENADDIVLAHTRFQPADEQATDFSRFSELSITGKVFREVHIERFEGLVQSSYFLVRTNDVLRFDVVEKGVTDWTEPTLAIRALPEHAALRDLLRTLQVSP